MTQINGTAIHCEEVIKRRIENGANGAEEGASSVNGSAVLLC